MTHCVAEVKEEVLESYWGTGKSSTGKRLRNEQSEPVQGWGGGVGWGELLPAEGAGRTTYKPGGVRLELEKSWNRRENPILQSFHSAIRS